MKRIVIIGGGISGLATAYYLRQLQQGAPLQFETILLEGSSRIGGIVRTEFLDDFLIEHGPDSFISEKPAALELANRLGLAPRLIETNPQHRRSLIVRNGRLRPVPEGFQLLAPTRLWPFISSDIFSWPGKARMALDLLLPRRSGNGQTDESLASFVTRRLGREALERMAQPLVGGIYTADPTHLSLRATLPRFLDLEQSDRSLILGMRRRGKQMGTSGARYSLFLSFDRGMQVLTDQLAAELPAGCVRLNTNVKRLLRDSDSAKWSVVLQSGEAVAADAVGLALPAHGAAGLLIDLDQRLAHELQSITYESTATVNLAFKRTDISHELDGFGFVVPFIEKRSLLACTFSSVKFAGRAPDGYALLRAFVGGALQPEMFSLTDEVMVSKVMADLQQLLGIKAEPRFVSVTKWPRSMPQYYVGHLDRVGRIEKLIAGIPGLAIAGNAYSGVGIPDCVRSGEAAAQSLLEMLKRGAKTN